MMAPALAIDWQFLPVNYILSCMTGLEHPEGDRRANWRTTSS